MDTDNDSKASTPLSAVDADGVARPFAVQDVPWQRFGHGDRFAIEYQVLSQFAGGSQITVCMEILPPGKQANQAHYHLAEEEHVYVLEGCLTVRLGEHTQVMQSGHYICFPAGQRVAHALFNHSDAPCRYLVLGNPQKHDVVVYPDSGRVAVRLAGESYRTTPTLDYWDGVAP